MLPELVPFSVTVNQINTKVCAAAHLYQNIKLCKISLMDGRELKERRNKLKLTRRQLGQLLGVTEDAVYRCEAGIRRLLPERIAAFETIEAKLKKSKIARCSKKI